MRGDLKEVVSTSRTVLGIVKLVGSRKQSCAFKRACDKARVSFKCEAVSSLQQGIAYLSGAGEYSDRRRYPCRHW